MISTHAHGGSVYSGFFNNAHIIMYNLSWQTCSDWAYSTFQHSCLQIHNTVTVFTVCHIYRKHTISELTSTFKQVHKVGFML